MKTLSPQTIAAMVTAETRPTRDNLTALSVESWEDGYNGALEDIAAMLAEMDGVPTHEWIAGLRKAANTRGPRIAA